MNTKITFLLLLIFNSIQCSDPMKIPKNLYNYNKAIPDHYKIAINQFHHTSYSTKNQFDVIRNIKTYFQSLAITLLTIPLPLGAKQVLKNIEFLKGLQIHPYYNKSLSLTRISIDREEAYKIITSTPYLFLFGKDNIFHNLFKKQLSLYNKFDSSLNFKGTINGLGKKLNLAILKYKDYFTLFNKKINYKKYKKCKDALDNALSKILMNKKTKNQYEECYNFILNNNIFDKKFTIADYLFHQIIASLYAKNNDIDLFLKNNDHKNVLNIFFSNIDYSDRELQIKIAYNGGIATCILTVMCGSLKLGYTMSKFILKKSFNTRIGTKIKDYTFKKLNNIDHGNNKFLLGYSLMNVFNFKNEDNTLLPVLKRSLINNQYSDIYHDNGLLSDEVIQIARAMDFDMNKIEDMFKLLFILQYYIVNPGELKNNKLIAILKFIFGEENDQLNTIDTLEIEKQAEEIRNTLFENNIIESNAEINRAKKEKSLILFFQTVLIKLIKDPIPLINFLTSTFSTHKMKNGKNSDDIEKNKKP
jgi:hypothetical protein